MAWTLAQSRISNTTALAFSSNVTAGNLLVVCVESSSTNITGISDTLGSSWSTAVAQNSGVPRCWLFYATAAGSGANTVTLTGAGGDRVLCIAEYSGLAGTVDGTASGGPTTSSHPIATGNVTVLSAGSLVVCFWGADANPGSSTAGTGFTQQKSVFNGASSSGAFADGAFGASFTPDFTSVGSSIAWGLVAASFPLAGGGGASAWDVSMLPAKAAPIPPPAPTRPPAPVPAWLFPGFTGVTPSTWFPGLAQQAPRPAAPPLTPKSSTPPLFLFAPGVNPRPPGGLTRIKALPFLSRNPRESAERRLARILDNLSNFWNSLARQGQLVQSGMSDYTIHSKSHVNTRDPGAFDDFSEGYTIGALWTNSATLKVFICVSNAAGAAIWKVIAS